MDKRKHRRIYKSLPMSYQTAAPVSEESQEDRGTLKDISLGGIYFKCKGPLMFTPGQVLDFTIASTPHTTSADKKPSPCFQGQGSVVRIDPPRKESPFFGVAVQFLEPLDLAQMLCKPKS